MSLSLVLNIKIQENIVIMGGISNYFKDSFRENITIIEIHKNVVL